MLNLLKPCQLWNSPRIHVHREEGILPSGSALEKQFHGDTYYLESCRSKTVSTNSFFTIILGDFNARSSSWWKEDKTATKGTHFEALTSLHNFHQLISEPTHLLPHSNPCIDLIFTDQLNLEVNCGTHSSLNSKSSSPDYTL